MNVNLMLAGDHEFCKSKLTLAVKHEQLPVQCNFR